jgi:hypothetical protein
VQAERGRVFSDSLTQGPPAKQCASTEQMRQLKIDIDQNRLQSIEKIQNLLLHFNSFN